MIWLSAFERTIAELEAHGLRVERVGPGLAYSLCPCCLANGKRELLEIRALPNDDLDLGPLSGGAA